MNQRLVNGRLIRLTTGDITMLEVDAFVYDARPDLVLGSGYGGAIAVRGGASVQKELTSLAPVKVGDAVVSSGGNLKARFIIHAVAPKFQEEHEEEKLRAATTSALVRADERGLARVAFPALGAGFYGMPAGRSARIMLEAIAGHLATATPVTEVTLCLLDSRQRAAFEHALELLNA